MSKYEVLIKAVTIQGPSYGQVAARFGVPKSLVHKLHYRWLLEGDAAFEPRSRRPQYSPNRTPDKARAQIVQLRDELTLLGLDAGADTIRELLARDSIDVSRSTVFRILSATGRVDPQPQKRPRSSWIRFAADRPNQRWQSDFTHVRLTTSDDIEVIGWLDDHSRFLLHLSAHHRVTGRIGADTFTSTALTHGYPTSTLTDNGMVYTTRYARGAAGHGPGNAFETLLALNGITQQNGKPFKPTTQGKIERFWQTLKKHLATQNPSTIIELQNILDKFRNHYNTVRPHRALARHTPEFAYQLIPKATPTSPEDPDLWRVRYDTIDNDGKISLRHSGRMLHLGIGRAHGRTEVICLIHNHEATVITHTGTILAEFTLNPATGYQKKNG